MSLNGFRLFFLKYTKGIASEFILNIFDENYLE